MAAGCDSCCEVARALVQPRRERQQEDECNLRSIALRAAQKTQTCTTAPIIWSALVVWARGILRVGGSPRRAGGQGDRHRCMARSIGARRVADLDIPLRWHSGPRCACVGEVLGVTLDPHVASGSGVRGGCVPGWLACPPSGNMLRSCCGACGKKTALPPGPTSARCADAFPVCLMLHCHLAQLLIGLRILPFSVKHRANWHDGIPSPPRGKWASQAPQVETIDGATSRVRNSTTELRASVVARLLKRGRHSMSVVPWPS